MAQVTDKGLVEKKNKLKLVQGMLKALQGNLFGGLSQANHRMQESGGGHGQLDLANQEGRTRCRGVCAGGGKRVSIFNGKLVCSFLVSTWPGTSFLPLSSEQP